MSETLDFAAIEAACRRIYEDRIQRGDLGGENADFAIVHLVDATVPRLIARIKELETLTRRQQRDIEELKQSWDEAQE